MPIIVELDRYYSPNEIGQMLKRKKSAVYQMLRKYGPPGRRRVSGRELLEMLRCQSRALAHELPTNPTPEQEPSIPITPKPVHGEE